MYYVYMMESQDFNNPTSFSNVPAGFWIRFVASIIDSIIVLVAYFIIFFVLGFFLDFFTIFTVASILHFIFALGYYIFFPSSDMMGTPGKALLGLKITDESGNKIGVGKSILRYIGYIISALVLCIGFIIVGFTENKRGLHDMVASTRVTYK